ncbi:hypothetical protein SLE2022_080250 [Rubroshorea leprosula]
MDPVQIIEHPMCYRREFKRAQDLPNGGREHGGRRDGVRWFPPAAPLFKLNVDGAISEQQRIFGIGAIIRDESGNVMAALQARGHGYLSPEVVELACGRA